MLVFEKSSMCLSGFISKRFAVSAWTFQRVFTCSNKLVRLQFRICMATEGRESLRPSYSSPKFREEKNILGVITILEFQYWGLRTNFCVPLPLHENGIIARFQEKHDKHICWMTACLLCFFQSTDDATHLLQNTRCSIVKYLSHSSVAISSPGQKQFLLS